jgi:DNA recombination protein RmuC
MIQIIILVIAVAIFLLLVWQILRANQLEKNPLVLQQLILQQLEEKHRAMLLDVNDGLNKLGDRLSASSSDISERLRMSVATELQATRDAMQALQLAQNNSLSLTRETVLEKLHTTLAEQLYS